MILTDSLLKSFQDTRNYTHNLCRPLEIEDYVVQPIEDVSPPKWHLGHSTWFFEEFILKPHLPNYRVYSDDFAFIFNSYYESLGKRVVRSNRGNLSRPSVESVYDYRRYVTEAVNQFYSIPQPENLYQLLEIGTHHEKQHQELLLTDIKYILGNNPLLPAYSLNFREFEPQAHPQDWISIDEGVYEVGHKDDSFCYDNELAVHKVYLNAYQISNTLVTNGDYIAFIEAGGYRNFEYWHAEGWDWVENNGIKSPMYWHSIDGKWHHYTLAGLTPVEANVPVSHISYYEAFAYAQWSGSRLPTEFEWEVAQQYFPWGERWEWTESAYLPYPGYTKAPGALGEYNGKFMVNQKVLKGASVATPPDHSRHTYRNFFHPNLRWQYTGLRLAK